MLWHITSLRPDYLNPPPPPAQPGSRPKHSTSQQNTTTHPNSTQLSPFQLDTTRSNTPRLDPSKHEASPPAAAAAAARVLSVNTGQPQQQVAASAIDGGATAVDSPNFEGRKNSRRQLEISSNSSRLAKTDNRSTSSAAPLTTTNAFFPAIDPISTGVRGEEEEERGGVTPPLQCQTGQMSEEMPHKSARRSSDRITAVSPPLTLQRGGHRRKEGAFLGGGDTFQLSPGIVTADGGHEEAEEFVFSPTEDITFGSITRVDTISSGIPDDTVETVANNCGRNCGPARVNSKGVLGVQVSAEEERRGGDDGGVEIKRDDEWFVNGSRRECSGLAVARKRDKSDILSTAREQTEVGENLPGGAFEAGVEGKKGKSSPSRVVKGGRGNGVTATPAVAMIVGPDMGEGVKHARGGGDAESGPIMVAAGKKGGVEGTSGPRRCTRTAAMGIVTVDNVVGGRIGDPDRIAGGLHARGDGAVESAAVSIFVNQTSSVLRASAETFSSCCGGGVSGSSDDNVDTTEGSGKATVSTAVEKKATPATATATATATAPLLISSAATRSPSSLTPRAVVGAGKSADAMFISPSERAAVANGVKESAGDLFSGVQADHRGIAVDLRGMGQGLAREGTVGLSPSQLVNQSPKAAAIRNVEDDVTQDGAVGSSGGQPDGGRNEARKGNESAVSIKPNFGRDQGKNAVIVRGVEGVPARVSGGVVATRCVVGSPSYPRDNHGGSHRDEGGEVEGGSDGVRGVQCLDPEVTVAENHFCDGTDVV